MRKKSSFKNKCNEIRKTRTPVLYIRSIERKSAHMHIKRTCVCSVCTTRSYLIIKYNFIFGHSVSNKKFNICELNNSCEYL